MIRGVAITIGPPAIFWTSAAQASSETDFLPSTFWEVVIGLLVLSVGALIVQLITLKYRGFLLHQALKERDEAMDAMRVSKAMYQDLFDMAPVGIFRSTLDGAKYLAVNHEAARLYGYDSVQDFLDNISPLNVYAEPDVRQKIVATLAEKGFVNNVEVKLLRRDGSIRNVLMTARLYPEDKFVEGCVVDVTEHRAIQQNLADKGRFLQALLDAMSTPLFYKTTDGKYRLVNDAFLRMLGTTPEATLGKTVYDVSPPDKAAIYQEMDDELFSAKGPAQQRYETTIAGQDDTLDVVFNKQTVLDATGQIEGVLGVITDITPIKRQERKIDEQRTLLMTLFDSASEFIFFKNCEGVYLGCNDKYAGNLDLNPQDIVGKTDFDLYPQGLAEQFIAKDKSVLHSLDSHRYELEVPYSKNNIIVEIVKAPLISATGEVLGVMGISRDITERKKLERALTSAEERYRAIFENATEGIFTATPQGRFLNANAAMARLFGYDSPDVLMNEIKDIAQQLYKNPQDRTDLMNRVREEKTVAGFQAQCLRRDGTTFWIELHIRGIFGGDGELYFTEGIAIDATSRKASEQELRRLAATDSLTGLPNREQFRKTCAHMLAQAKRSNGIIGIVYIDLDGFKEINDTCGHAVGDELLIQVSDRLRWRLRQSDIAARLGGDEFAVLLWDVQGVETVVELGKKLVDTLTDTYQCCGQDCSISASIGASIYPHHGTDMNDLLEKADMAMYAVKRSGKSNFKLADKIVETKSVTKDHSSKDTE